MERKPGVPLKLFSGGAVIEHLTYASFFPTLLAI